MVKTNYANAYKEVLIILNNLIKEDYNKIPKEYIEILKANCNNNYDFYYDKSKPFEQQELLDETKYILFGLFEKFGATELQKEKIRNFKNNYYKKMEKEKQEKYDTNNIFNNKGNVIYDNKENNQENAIIDISNIKWYKKIWITFKKFIRKK